MLGVGRDGMRGVIYGIFFNLYDGKGWGMGNLTSTTIPLGPLGLPWLKPLRFSNRRLFQPFLVDTRLRLGTVISRLPQHLLPRLERWRKADLLLQL